MTNLICPECWNGDHDGCWGGAWDNDFDQPAPCRCWAYGHTLTTDVTADTWDVDVAALEARFPKLSKTLGRP
jgi:hypothetical protein